MYWSLCSCITSACHLFFITLFIGINCCSENGFFGECFTVTILSGRGITSKLIFILIFSGILSHVLSHTSQDH